MTGREAASCGDYLKSWTYCLCHFSTYSLSCYMQ